MSARGIYLAIAIWAVTTAALIVLVGMDTSAAPAGASVPGCIQNEGKQGHADDSRLKWRPLEEMAADQGVPAEFVALLQEHGAFTVTALRTGIGNGVPLPMGLAVARAVKRALQAQERVQA